jgi:hypothetical protein
MGYKTKLLVSLLVITAICFIDYQYFSEGMEVRTMNPVYRQAGHLAILLAIIPIGYWGWKDFPLTWPKRLWVLSYVSAIAILSVIGIIQWQTQIFSIGFLDRVGDARLFFGSPLAFLVLYMLTKISTGKTN